MKNLILLLSLFASLGYTYSQDERLDELPFKEEEPTEMSTPYFAIGGGITSSFLLIDNAGTNSLIANYNKINPQRKFAEQSGSMILVGGQGFTAIPWVPNLRVGINGMGGSLVSTATNSNTINNSLTTEEEVTNSFGSLGLSIGYGIVLFKGFAIVPELTIGRANHDITFLSSTKDAKADISSLNSSLSTSTAFNQTYTTLTPQLNIEWAFSSVAMLRGSFGYNYGIAGDWKVNKKETVTNMPSTVTSNAMFAQIGVFIGLFNY